MNGLNKAFFLGRLGADPESRTTHSGSVVVRLSVGTPNARKVNEDWVEGVDWHRLTFFGKDTDYLMKYAHKGDSICVECSIRPNKWTDAEGKAHFDIDFVGQRIFWLQGRGRAVQLSGEAGGESNGEVGARAESAASEPDEAVAMGAARGRGRRGRAADATEDGNEIPF